tara:strand:+ start:335 stop:727 length:393 start_codon:yes stop_codon:yes gene_type:complete
MIEIVIPGVPIAKKRPRFANRGKFVTVYDPDKKEQESIKILIKSLWKGKPLEKDVSIEIIFYMPIPKSWSKKKQQQLLENPHLVKPDVDNLLKLSLDCMNGIVYLDDRQIWNIKSTKIYSDNPRTVIKII